jgi:iron(III) transport system permease protein
VKVKNSARVDVFIGSFRPPVKRLNWDPKYLGFWLLTLVLGTLVVAPLALLLLNSFREVSVGELGFDFTRLTLGNYTKAYSDPQTATVAINSLRFALGSTALGILIGGTLAFFSERTDLSIRRSIALLVIVPLILPSIVKAIAWILLLSPNIGLLNLPWIALFGSPLFSPYSMTAMVLVEGINMSPLAFLLIGSILKRMDPALEEASLAAGGSPRHTLRRITLPLMLPGLAGVALLLFIRGIEAFEIPMLMGVNAGIFVLSADIYRYLRYEFPPDYGLGFALSMFLIVFAVLGLFFYNRLLYRSERYAVLAGKGYQPRPVTLGHWKYLGWLIVAAYGFCAILLPLLVLFWTSFLPFYMPPSIDAISKLSLRNYAKVFGDPALPGIIFNTLILGFLSSVGVMFVSLLGSWFVYRTNIRGRKVLDSMIFLPYAIPGIVVGVAFMILFLSFPNPLYNTIWIMLLAYIVNYLPTGSRFTNAAIVQIHKELEEASWTSGAGFWRTLKTIWIPLLIPALVNGSLFLFILSLKVLSIAAMLQGPDSMVFPIYLWKQWDSGQHGLTCALSILLVVILGALTLVSRRFVEGTGGGYRL